MLQLILTLDITGNLKLQGDVSNKVLCYGMLEAAKDLVATAHQQAQRSVQLANGALPDLAGKAGD